MNEITHEFECVNPDMALYMAGTLRDAGVPAIAGDGTPVVSVTASPALLRQVAEQSVDKGLITPDELRRLPALPLPPDHSGKTHRLPVSNGLFATTGPDDVTVYTVRCGRCVAEFRPDREWLLRYGAHRRNHYARAHGRGYYDAEEYAERTALLVQDEADIATWLGTIDE